MWKCGSTKGGETRQPVASKVRGRLGLDARGDVGDAVAGDGDVGAAAVGQGAAGEKQIEGHRSPLR